jgi:hypothetical protein
MMKICGREKTYLIGVYKKSIKLDLKQSEIEEVRKLIVELRNELKKIWTEWRTKK